MSLFTKQRIQYTHLEIDRLSKKEVLHVRNMHALTQAAGYLKFVLAPEGKHVWFRGQNCHYGSLEPSLFRRFRTSSGHQKAIAAVRKAVASYAESAQLLAQVSSEAREPLLQHYGLRTSWIDLVDNVWISLWFACHHVSSTPDGKHLHFEQRIPRNEPENQRFAYILLIATDFGTTVDSCPGLWRGPTTETIDLRIATPSIFIRPHAQHGVLFRLRGTAANARPSDYSDAIKGVIRVDLADALDWLGSGSLLKTHSLFPPPFYDHGFRLLLDADTRSTDVQSRVVGRIHHVGS
jgi:hypothetical protein